MVRKYDEQDIIRLLVAAGGRCTICNADVMNDKLTNIRLKTAENAHIKAFKNNGPRADKLLTTDQRNSVDNLMVLCPTCHATIDKKDALDVYTVEWLLETKRKKELLVKTALEKLNANDCISVKYTSAIGKQNFNFNDNDLFRTGHANGFCASSMVNLCEDCNSEAIIGSLKQIDDKFNKRIQTLIDNGESKTICLFALAPQPILIYLGTKFNDKQDLKVFTKHRNGWKYDERVDENITFSVTSPSKKNKKHNVALILSATADIAQNRITTALGSDVDIWCINSSRIGTDIINNQAELQSFYNTCVSAIDQIGKFYGKDASINVFPAICNSLAITFGRAKFAKCHNKLNIFDAETIDGSTSFTEKLSI